MHASTLHTLYDRQTIASRVQEVAAEINTAYSGQEEPVVAICVLKGACIFFADLVRHLTLPLELDFVRLASYGQQTERSEKVLFSKDIETSIQGKHVLIVEDIVDTGHTMVYLRKVLMARGPKSVALCSLIDKTGRREVDVHVDFYGFRLDKGFVVGYGLDCAEAYRQLDGIYELIQA